MPLAVGRGEEPPAGAEHALQLGQSTRAIRHVVEHVVGDGRIERPSREGQRLRVSLDKGKTLQIVARERLLRRSDHPWREVAERDTPARRGAEQILAPEVSWPATDLEDARLGAERREQ